MDNAVFDKLGLVFSMSNLTAFKSGIFKYTIIISVICQLASLPFLGLNPQFSYGLALGTAVSIGNFNILEFTSKKVIMDKKASFAFIGYLMRLAIYGGAFYFSMKVGIISGLGCLIGFLSLKLAIYYLHGIKTKFSSNRKVSPEVKAEYERMDAQREASEKTGIRKIIEEELGYRDDDDFFKEEEAVKPLKKTNRSYKRKKLKG